MQSVLYADNAPAGLELDYKQFIREFERYRNIHPDLSVQQALDALLEPQAEAELAEAGRS